MLARRRRHAHDSVRRQHLNYIATLRYFHFRRFLEGSARRFRRIILADTRDVALQAKAICDINTVNS